MVIRMRLEKWTRADWQGPARLALDAGAIAACVAVLGLPLFEWPAAVGIACFTGAAYQARLAIAEYRERRQSR
jgi:hypothetical protein